MTCMKKLTALLVSAALALSLLAGCGGSKALSQVIADLLSGQYNNVTVEVDPDLTAALKKAAAAGSTQEEVLAALVENLNLSGVNLSFNNLGDGQQGQHGVTLTFQPGSDPDAAARSAFTEWNRVFSSLPDDGSYRAHVSMIEAEGGYYIAVDVEVLKAGSHDKDEPDEPNEPDGPGYTETVENGITTYTVTTGQGLKEVAAEVNTLQDNGNIVIKLQNSIDLSGIEWTPIGSDSTPYTGTFNGNDKTISGLNVSSGAQCVGLFGYIQGGTVQALTLDTPTVNSTYDSGGDDDSIGYVGAVTGVNDGGTIENCHITGVGTISASANASNVGGVVGYNAGSVTGCSSTGNVTATGSGDTFAGGVVGFNLFGSITACYSTGDVNGHHAGGVVGDNWGPVTACYSTSDVTGSLTGGVVACDLSYFGTDNVTACYWSGTVDGNKGIGNADDDDDLTGKATKVDGSTVKWTESVRETLSAMDAMNEALKGGDWQYLDNTASGNPPLTLKKTG